MCPSNPLLHSQNPVESLQIPWFEHVPSPGHSYSKFMPKKCVLNIGTARYQSAAKY